MIQALLKVQWWETRYCKRIANKVADFLSKMDFPMPHIFPVFLPQAAQEQYIQDLHNATTYCQMFRFTNPGAGPSSSFSPAECASRLGNLSFPERGTTSNAQAWAKLFVLGCLFLFGYLVI